jgi:NAD(P)-dependent dehydrogenase (short-subunit alcohol dehydrogenase family)
MNLQNRVALVAGGSLGIGLAAAAALASDAATVVICGRDPDRLKSAASEIARTSVAAVEGIVADCGRDADVAELVSTTLEKFGHIDILVNSLQGPKAVTFLEATDADWLDALNVKLLGQIRCARHVFPHMIRQRWGRIINVSGTHGHLPSAYAMSAGVVNAALVNFSKALAELGAPHGILVNVVSPGPIQTDRTDYLITAKAEARGISREEAARQHATATLLNRIGTPDEVAAVIRFLASEQSTYVTAAVFSVDGGQYRAE